MKQYSKVAVCAFATALISSAQAAVSAEEAKQLGTTLTAWGAEKGRNSDGTIPAYSGEPTKKPASYDPKEPGQKPDPFDEKPLFSITAQNFSNYVEKLDGSVEMFKKFPNFRMDIYPTHRNWVYPKYVIDNTLKNSTACKAVKNELALEGCYGGFPFPIPKTGNQVMWNHLTQFEAPSYEGMVETFVTTINGQANRQVLTFITQTYPYYDPTRTGPLPSDLIFWQVRTSDKAPARQTGGSTVLLDPLDWTQGGRRAYVYIPGQRRVKLAPDLAYDTPSPYSGGGQTMDDQKGFQGSLDRFDFKLIGKKEKYILHNNYALFDAKKCPSEKAFTVPGYAHPDCVRWELHRVWQVNAALKAGFRHIYKTRAFFRDEDAPGVGITENYDASGKLYRLITGLSVPFYETPGGVGGIAGSAFLSNDLATGVAGAGGTGSCLDRGCGASPATMRPTSWYSPEAMAAAGVR